MRSHSRVVLVLTALATLAVVAAACGSKKSSTPGTAEVTFADLRGTAYAGSVSAPLTHRFEAIVRTPASEPKTDRTSNYSAATGTGCVVRHLANTPSDTAAGVVTIGGYNAAHMFAVVGTAAQPATQPIQCAQALTDGQYQCRFATSGTFGGAIVDDVVFPLLPYEVVSRSNPSNVLAGPFATWPYGDAACVSRLIDNPQEPNPSSPVTYLKTCEQVAVSQFSEITEQVAGGAAVGPQTQTLGTGTDFPTFVFATHVKSGATEITGTDPVTFGPSLDLADGSLAPTSPLTVDYQCLSTTAGFGCIGHTAELKVQTFAQRKTDPLIAIEDEIDCFQPMTVASNSATMTMTVTSAQMAAVLAGKTGGSVRLELLNLDPKLTTDTKPAVLFGAGQGVYGSVNE